MGSEEGPGRAKRILVLLVLCLTTMCTMSDFVITPIVSDLFEVFGESSVNLIDFGITGPALVGAPFLIMSGWLCDHYDRRLIMIAGFALFTVAATAGAVVENIWYWLACRLLVGVGWGLTSTTAYSIIVSVYVDDLSCSKAVGLYDAALSIMGAALAFFSGLLAVGGWSHAYKLYLMAVPVLALLFLLPSCPPNRQSHNSSVAFEKDVPQKWKRALARLSIQILIVGVCYYETVYMLSLYVTSAGLGAEAFTGTLSSVSTIAGAVAALLFGVLYKRLRDSVYLPFVLVLGVAILVMSFFPNRIAVPACMVVIGFSWQIFYCYFYIRSAFVAPTSKQGMAVGVVGLMNSLAAALCSFFLTFLMSVVRAESALVVWPVFGVTPIALAVLILATLIISRMRNSQ